MQFTNKLLAGQLQYQIECKFYYTDELAICLTGIVTHTVKPYQKYALVWAGTYKSIADIPDRVS